MQERLLDELQQVASEICSLTLEKLECEKKASSIRMRIVVQQARLEEPRSVFSEVKKRIDDLYDTKNGLYHEKEELYQQLAKAKERRESLEVEFRNCRDNLTVLRSRESSLKRELKEIDERISQTGNEAQSVSIGRLAREEVHLSEALESLIDDIEYAEGIMLSVQDELVGFKNEQARLTQRIVEVRESLNSTKMEIEELKAKKEELTEAINKLKAEINGLYRISYSYKSKRDECIKKIQELRKKQADILRQLAENA